MAERFLGYLLLIIGIGIIIYSTYNVYQVFTKQIAPLQFFNLPAPKLDVAQLLSNSMPDQFSQLVQKPTSGQQIIDPALINEPFNLTAHLFLMGFIVSVGFKIASLGTMLMRPIVVKVKGVTEEKTPPQS